MRNKDDCIKLLTHTHLNLISQNEMDKIVLNAFLMASFKAKQEILPWENDRDKLRACSSSRMLTKWSIYRVTNCKWTISVKRSSQSRFLEPAESKNHKKFIIFVILIEQFNRRPKRSSYKDTESSSVQII